MNWFIIISITLLLTLIAAPIFWLLRKAINQSDFTSDSGIDKLVYYKELEMIDRLYEKQRKN